MKSNLKTIGTRTVERLETISERNEQVAAVFYALDEVIQSVDKCNRTEYKHNRKGKKRTSIEVMGMWKMLVLQRYGSELYFQTLHLWEDINEKYQRKN